MFQTTVALLIFLFPLAYSPGPGNLFFAANGARFGFRATVPANFGYHTATWLVTVAVGFGFSAAITQFPSFFDGVKVVGSFYVLWLSWKLFRAGSSTQETEAQPANFLAGALLLVLNPKAYIIMALMFSQFLTLLEMEQAIAVLLISTVFTLNNLVAFSLWTLAGDKIATKFRTSGRAGNLNQIFGLILASVALWMLLG